MTSNGGRVAPGQTLYTVGILRLKPSLLFKGMSGTKPIPSPASLVQFLCTKQRFSSCVLSLRYNVAGYDVADRCTFFSLKVNHYKIALPKYKQSQSGEHAIGRPNFTLACISLPNKTVEQVCEVQPSQDVWLRLSCGLFLNLSFSTLPSFWCGLNNHFLYISRDHLVSVHDNNQKMTSNSEGTVGGIP